MRIATRVIAALIATVALVGASVPAQAAPAKKSNGITTVTVYHQAVTPTSVNGTGLGTVRTFFIPTAVNGSGSDLERLRVRWNARELPFPALAVRANPQRSAMHAETGVLILSGPTIRSNEEIQGASIVDFAPTLLAAIGAQIPETPFDGDALDVFRPK